MTVIIIIVECFFEAVRNWRRVGEGRGNGEGWCIAQTPIERGPVLSLARVLLCSLASVHPGLNYEY